MASSKQIDLNVISRNNAPCDSALGAITIDQIAYVDQDSDGVTTILYDNRDDSNTSNNPDIYKVEESMNTIIVKADAADSDNGLKTVNITKKDNISVSKIAIINLTKINRMKGIAGGGTRIVYGRWFKTILEVSDNLVTETSSASS
jgi:hypothetical protein